MNTLQMIWSALTVPNEMLFNIIALPLNYVDALVCMLYFSTILNIESTKKRKIIYVIAYGTISTALNFLVPKSYIIYINLILWPLMVFFILKATILKSILSEIITMVTTSTLDFIFTQIAQNLFNMTFDIMIVTPIYRLTIALCIY